jgi:site-specific DNA recombinase
MEVALYVRVSTTRQQQTQTIEQQMARLREHLATHPDWHLAEEHIYRDDGYSGAKLNRPGLDRLRDRAAMAGFERILITAPDRLARNYVHQMLLIDELAQRGCQVEFLERPMSEDPHDQLLLQIRGAVAEYERTLITDRMRRGRQAKLRSGQMLPWSVPPYGYMMDPERPRDPQRLRVDPVKAAVITQIFAWYTDPQARATLYGVAKRLTDAHIPTPRGGPRWNVASVRGILCSPVYTGTAYSERTRQVPARIRQSALRPVGAGHSHRPAPPDEWIAIPVPAIISQETFAAAQARLARNTQMARRNNTAHEYLLRGLVSCGQCQLSCMGRTLPTGYHYYLCRGRTDALRAAQGERCTARFAPARALDELVWQDLCRILTEPALITHELARAHGGEWLPQALQARRKTLRDALAQLERQQTRLLEVYLAEIIGRDEFERKRQEVIQTQQGLSQQLRQLEAQAQQQVNIAALAQGLEAFCRKVQPTLDQLTFAQRRQLVELLIDRVIVTADQVEIRYVVPTGPTGETTPFCHLRLDYLNGPAWRVTLHNLLRLHRDICRQEIFVAMGPCTIMNVDPTDCNQLFSDTVPVSRARDDLDVSPGAPIPRHREAGAFGRVRHHLLGRGQLLALHARAAHRVARARGWRFVQRGITIKLAHQGEVLAVLLAKPRRLAGTVAAVAYEDEVSIWKPAHQARQQQPDNVRWRLMTRARHTIPLGGTVQSHQDGEGPRACRERPFHEHRHDDPLMPPAIGDIAVGRAYPIAMPSLAKHLGAWVLSDRIVASQQHRPGRNYMVQQERDQGMS